MNPDQTKRTKEIAILETVVAKNAAAIQTQELILAGMRDKQVNRLAELRFAKLMLNRALERARLQAICDGPKPARTE